MNVLDDSFSDDVLEYIYCRSARQNAYTGLFLNETDGIEKEVETVTKILSIFKVARNYCGDLMENDLVLITFIDNRFSNAWLDLLEYASYRSYGRRYFRILFWATRKGLLESLDSASVLRGDLDEHFAEVLECTTMSEQERRECFEWIAK